MLVGKTTLSSPSHHFSTSSLPMLSQSNVYKSNVILTLLNSVSSFSKINLRSKRDISKAYLISSENRICDGLDFFNRRKSIEDSIKIKCFSLWTIYPDLSL